MRHLFFPFQAVLTTPAFVCYDNKYFLKGGGLINHIFDPNNTFFSTLSRLVDIVGLSLCWAILCLPVVTIGPASAALYYTVVKAFRQDQPGTFVLFFKSLWGNLKKGVLCTLICVPVGLLIYLVGYWYALAADTQGNLGVVLYVFFRVLALIPVALLCWLFPLLGRFEFTVGQLFSTALQLLIAHLPTTVLLLLLTIACCLAVLSIPLLLFLIPALWALLASYLLERAFAKHMPSEEETPS